MNKLKAVELLCSGVTEWNRHREEKMDLSHLEIRNTDFSGADFSATDFDGSRLQNVNMSNCCFKSARFNGVSASLTDFSDADFTNAEIKGTDLSQCNLDRATIKGVVSYLWKNRHSSFVGAQLHPERMAHAHFYNCNFSQSDFAESDYEYTDLKRPQIDISREAFLVRNGVNIQLVRQPRVTDWVDWENQRIPLETEDSGVVIFNYEAYWITENRWDLFISYQTAQKGFAAEMAAQLKSKGLRVWFDSATLTANDSLLQSIDTGLNACPFGVAIVSEDYFGRKWTEYELEKLMSKRMLVVLHGIQPDRVLSLYPGLSDKIMLMSDLGIQSLCQIILETIRRPPRNLV